ncbi:hypothetical protein ACH4ZX_26340 [Streptomyces sp. NPDC020490]|uniref:hypothetical protein n=1 Tax=Streptomyces sp. NPDC020490 TaxID=3365078 RepID=UPI0037A77650
MPADNDALTGRTAPHTGYGATPHGVGGEPAAPEVAAAGAPGLRDGRSRVAAIGEWVRVAGLTAAGVDVFAAEDPPAVRAARERIPADVGLVIMTPAAAAALGPEPFDDTGPLTAVMPS